MTWRYVLTAFTARCYAPTSPRIPVPRYRRFSRPNRHAAEQRRQGAVQTVRCHRIAGASGLCPNHKNPPGYRSSLQMIADHFMCGRGKRARHSNMLKACSITSSRKLHSLTELVSAGCGLNGKGPDRASWLLCGESNITPGRQCLSLVCLVKRRH